MKRLASQLSQLLMLVIVSTLVIQRGFNRINPDQSSRKLLTHRQLGQLSSLSSFALVHAQEYSSIEERIYIAERLIDQHGNEHNREYAESFKSLPDGESDLAIVAAQRADAPTSHKQQQPLSHLQHDNYAHQQGQPQQQQQHINSQPYQQVRQHVPSPSDNQQYQPQQTAHLQPIPHDAAQLQQTGQNSQKLVDGQHMIYSHHQPQQHHHHLHQHHHHHHQQQQIAPQVTAPHSNLLNHQAPDNMNHQHHRLHVESMQQVLMSARRDDNRHASNRQYHYAHTQINWRRESRDGDELSEFYLHNYQAISSASYHNQPLTVEDQLTYYQYHQKQKQQQLNQRSSDQQQQQQQIDEQQVDHYHQQHQLANDLHHHIHAQQQSQQHQQYFYARHLDDEHDFEAAHQYYYTGRPLMSARHSPSCDSIEDSSILILPSQFEQSTCRAASTLGSADDPAAAAAQATSDSFNAHNPSRNSNVESFPLTPQHYHYESSLIAAIRHYWREVVGLCIASAIFLNWLFVVVKRKIIGASGGSAVGRAESMNEASILDQSQQQQQISLASTAATKSLSKDTNTNSAHDSAFEEHVSPHNTNDADTSQSQSSSSLPNEKSTASLQEERRKRSTSPVLRQRSSTLRADAVVCCQPNHASLSQSTSLSTTISNTSEYISRYSSDFDSIQRLGRGGFGIVFEARNKIDDCHYAVKRICLPLEKEARERVMREVRALAKLDHAGIVRYYNAWLETPPDEWLRQHDAQLGVVHSRDGVTFPSTDGIYDRGESDFNNHNAQQTRGGNRGALGQSGDNSSDWFGATNNKSSLRHRRANGYNNGIKFLRNNSSSPSLDIVFEGSGSIRLEAENNTKQTNSNKLKSKVRKQEKNSGDTNNSDSEDSDFIQFKSRGNDEQSNALNDLENDHGEDSSDDNNEASISANHLTEPFSSTSSGSVGAIAEKDDIVTKRKGRDGDRLVATAIGESRKNALNYQREMRRLQNGENNIGSGLHFEKVYLYIQMQLCRKDTLRDWLRNNCDNRDKTIIFDLFYQIVDAVEYVHSQDLIHRDLKPSNIFFSLDGTLKIGDFGLCRAKTNAGVGSSLDLQEYVAESEVERSFDAVHTEQVGTQLYMSPEQLNGLSYNQKVDIFAMGLILLELLIPFKTQMQRVNVLFKARNNLYSDEFKLEHPKEYELVKILLSRSPQKRPAAAEIKQHELLANAQLSQPVIERIYHRRRTISSNSSTE